MERWGAAAMAMMALGQAGVRTDDARESYDFPGKGKLELLGICDIGVEATRCWDRTGTIRPALSKQMEAFYLVGQPRDLLLRVGLKNRFVVFRRGLQVSLAYTFPGTDKPALEQSINRGNEYNLGSALEWGRVLLEPAARTFQVVVQTPERTQLPGATLPAVPGSFLQYHGVTYTVGETKAVPKRAGRKDDQSSREALQRQDLNPAPGSRNGAGR
ncbi:MAG: hypothetical protein EOP88_28065, partial [Verrucomicrobiaceae bacterium]